jgi:Flp pilus assembly protein TadD
MSLTDSQNTTNSSLEDLLTQGENAASQGDWATAKVLFERAKEQAPGNWKVLRGLGITAFWTDRKEDAWTLLNTVIRAAPQDPDNTANLLDVAQALGRETDAHALLRGLSSQYPEFTHLSEGLPATTSPADIFCQQGEELLQKSQWQEALLPFLKGIDQDAACARTWSGIGISCFQMGLPQAARYFFEMACRIDPSDEDSVMNLAQIGAVSRDEIFLLLHDIGVSAELQERVRQELRA